LFYDYARGTDNHYLELQDGDMVEISNNKGTESFRSFGFELISDFYLFRIPYMISAGVQAAWKAFGQAPSLEMVFSIDIYGMKIGRLRR
jgi:hypothetical protein